MLTPGLLETTSESAGDRGVRRTAIDGCATL